MKEPGLQGKPLCDREPLTQSQSKIQVESHASERFAQMSSAVGGAERSCYRCVLPFGLVAMLVGTVDSVVALTLGPPTSSAAVLGLLLLSLGVTLLLSGFICCQLQHWRKVRRLRASLIPLDDGGEAEGVKTGGHVV